MSASKLNPREAKAMAAQFLPSIDNLAAFSLVATHRQSTPAIGDARLLFAASLFPELAEWRGVLRRLSIPIEHAIHMADRARRNGTDFQTELLASGVDQEAFYRALAVELGVYHVSLLDADRLVVTESQAVAFLCSRKWHLPVRILERDGGTSYLIAPERQSIGALRRITASRPNVLKRLKITSPSALRAALFARIQPLLERIAVYGLFERFPDYSARIVVNAWQGVMLGLMAAAFPVALWADPGATWMAVHCFFTFFFLACVALRFIALQAALPQRPVPIAPVVESDLPVFSILVALYKEAEVVGDLVRSLDALVWPKGKLEIKLVCEEDDRTTLDALCRIRLPASFEVIEVPPVGPRTKPKALAYALPLVSGEFVTLFDAEDRPDPLQLIQAWQRFQASGPDLACVQAPLEISNRDKGPVALMFSFEYAGLFRGILPWLSRNGLVMPLGGTSNHFRRAVLEEVGGWDPHNVTEDADLGIRLTRFGYRTETITSPTYEEAPETLAAWIPQRTRWFKGWVQTWLVHMRNPLRLLREVGVGSFTIFQITSAGMVVSALAHPFLVLTGLILAIDIILDRPMGVWRTLLFAVDIVNIACGYLSFLLLGWQTLDRRERKGFWKIVLLTPVYWVMMSFAAWRAVWQLWRDPHLWEKTPHGRAARNVHMPTRSSEAPRHEPSMNGLRPIR